MPLPRVFISTDLLLSSEEKDDAQSLIHALLYQDKMNIVGISATASYHGHQDGLVGDIDRIIDVYGRDQHRLEAHSSAFKSAAELKAISWQGALEVAPSAGHSNATDASRAIIVQAKAAAAAGEKLNVLTWGGEADLAQALHDDPGIAQHIRFFNISDQDHEAYDYIRDNFRGKLDMWVDDQTTFRGIYQTPGSSGIIKGWHEVHADGHGALGSYFSDLSGDIFNVSGVKMGDSPTVLRFLSGDQDDPTRESWGGEFIKVSDRYYTDNPHPDLDLGGRSNTRGGMTVYEDRAAWLGSFAERFDWLKDDAPSTPTTPTPTTPTPTTPGPAVPTIGNLLVNGSFEASSVASGQYATFQSVPGWTALAGGRIEVWNDHRGIEASDGADFVELDHAGARDGFYQDVQTRAGQGYDLSFDLRARPGQALGTQGVEVVWNGTVVATTRPGASWDDVTFTVTGTGGRDRLTIREVASQGGDGLGALLDDITLVARSSGPVGALPPNLDTITVRVSGDAYKGDPNFALLANGRVIDATNSVTADRSEGERDTFVFHGDFGLDGSDRVGVRFTNDLYERGVGDRNLHVDAVTVNGESNGANQTLYSNGTVYWDF